MLIECTHNSVFILMKILIQLIIIILVFSFYIYIFFLSIFNVIRLHNRYDIWKTNIILINNRSIYIFDRTKKTKRCEKTLIKFSVYNRKKR